MAQLTLMKKSRKYALRKRWVWHAFKGVCVCIDASQHSHKAEAPEMISISSIVIFA
jgi:hypothetical protein